MIDTSFLTFLIEEKTNQLKVIPIDGGDRVRAEIRECRRLLADLSMAVQPEPQPIECAWCGDPIKTNESTAKDKDGDICHFVCV